ncbi:transglutaminase family protein [Novosphingobium flavum]|uniref:Transglutaminase family protein n=1 Tax=Novosphingobium flavum TaxID=1778672 RepID=A0A7X1KMU5_9SPHN|nr:transglutaminase family protein [Novosphingobium flavum]MBC2667019.1 transglutaminase family protein [Novosphingobium flavum]
MKLSITAHLDYQFEAQADVLLQLEAAEIPEQVVEHSNLAIGEHAHFARVPGQDMIGTRIWTSISGRLTIDYSAVVMINRIVDEGLDLAAVPLHMLPGETVQYLMGSRYCPSDRFHDFVTDQFGALSGGERVIAMRDWIHEHFNYVPGASNADTTAVDTFVSRRGVCRDFAHVLICLARASGIPARIASVYALGVDPQDFHAVAEVFLGGEWHLVDATRMAREGAMAKIGIGRDAADVAFMTAYEPAYLIAQEVTVTHLG